MFFTSKFSKLLVCLQLYIVIDKVNKFLTSLFADDCQVVIENMSQAIISHR